MKLKPNTAGPAAERTKHRASAYLRCALYGLLLAALSGAGALWLIGPATFSLASSEAAAIIRDRRTFGPGDDVAAAIEAAAGQILSPAALLDAVRKTADAKATDASLTAAAEALRGRLRVDVNPGSGKQPWTISVRSPSADDAELVNLLAEAYCRSRRYAFDAERQAAYQAARLATEQATISAGRSQDEFDRQLQLLSERVGKLPSQAARPAVALPAAGDSSPHAAEPQSRKLELQTRIAGLEAQRAALLERLLPAHPEVQEVDFEIAAARAELSRLPAETPPDAPRSEKSGQADGNEIEPMLADLASRRQSQRQAAARAAELAAAERLAAEHALRLPRDEFVSLTPASLATAQKSRSAWRVLAPAGLLVLLVGWAFGRRRGRAPAVFRDVDELEAALGVPLVGMLEG